jgi:uronate dehydrogenase
MRHLLVTGGAGRIGRILQDFMPALGWQLRMLDCRETPEPAKEGIEVLIGDVRDADFVASAMTGMDAIVHLAGIGGAAVFDEALNVNVLGAHRVIEAAAVAGIRRVIVASSNHAVGFTPRCESLSVDIPLRPDTDYGWSKAAIESLCQLYVDRNGMEIACLRIGTCRLRPINVRQLATWLSPGDCVRLISACLSTPSLGFSIVYGISANTRAWWDLEPGRRLGYEPQDDAEIFARELLALHGELEPDDPDLTLVGGQLARSLAQS